MSRLEYFIAEGPLARYQANLPEIDTLIHDPDLSAHFIFTKSTNDFTAIHENWAKRIENREGVYQLIDGVKDGVTLEAPLAYWNASPALIEKHTGGCGPGGFGDRLVPDTIWGISVFLACQIHDWMYHQGKTLEDKKIADRVFLDNMLAIIEAKSSRWFIKSRSSRAMVYYMMVRDHGREAFLSKKMV